jgi:hypothetical protein
MCHTFAQKYQIESQLDILYQLNGKKYYILSSIIYKRSWSWKFPEQLSLFPVFVTRSLVFCVLIYRSLFVLCLFLLASVLSVLRFTAYAYPFAWHLQLLSQINKYAIAITVNYPMSWLNNVKSRKRYWEWH